MCGFVAGRYREKSDKGLVDQALKSIEHRGPDGTGTWFSADETWMLGHARLSIIGLDNGRQPISNSEGNVHLVVNGEFYGYQSIRESLKADGYNFSTESDSEIALHLYLNQGVTRFPETKRRVRGGAG